MILDERLEFIDALAIPTTAGTSILGDVIDLQEARDVGQGQPIYWYVACDVTAVGGTSAQFNLVTSNNSDGSSAVVLASSPVIALADLVGGRMLVMISLPSEGTAYRRYLALQGVVAGTMSAGQVSSGLTLDNHGWKAYPEGVN